MLSLKHIVLALACIASHLAGTSTASPTARIARSESVLPMALSTGVPSGSFPGLAKPTHRFTVPPPAATAVNGTGHCDDMPGNHTHAHTHGHHEHAQDRDHHRINQTGGPDPHPHNCTDQPLKPTGTKAPSSFITPAPDSTAANVAKFVQITYYTCVTIGPDSHCGWHEPILDAGTSNTAAGLAVAGKAWLSMVSILVAVMWM